MKRGIEEKCWHSCLYGLCVSSQYVCVKSLQRVELVLNMFSTESSCHAHPAATTRQTSAFIISPQDNILLGNCGGTVVCDDANGLKPSTQTPPQQDDGAPTPPEHCTVSGFSVVTDGCKEISRVSSTSNKIPKQQQEENTLTPLTNIPCVADQTSSTLELHEKLVGEPHCCTRSNVNINNTHSESTLHLIFICSPQQTTLPSS